MTKNPPSDVSRRSRKAGYLDDVDAAWFRSTCQVGVSTVGLAAALRMLQVFPFDYSAYAFNWAAVTRLVLVVAVFGSAVAIVVELVRLASHGSSAGGRSHSPFAE